MDNFNNGYNSGDGQKPDNANENNERPTDNSAQDGRESNSDNGAQGGTNNSSEQNRGTSSEQGRTAWRNSSNDYGYNSGNYQRGNSEYNRGYNNNSGYNSNRNGDNYNSYDYNYGYGNRSRKANQGMNPRPISILLLISVFVCVFSGIIGIAVGSSIAKSAYENPPEYDVTIVTDSVQNNPDDMGTYASVTKDVINSVVTIQTNNGRGSGVFISSDGFIVTCEHVISGATSIRVIAYNGSQYTATVVGSDVWSDLAVLKVEGTNFQHKNLATSSSGKTTDYISLGEEVIAIGNPLGELGWSVTSGIVSGIDRKVKIEGVTLDLIQTDTAVNPGNSGGALFDLYGNLIGIVNAKAVSEEVEGIAYAIPSDMAFDVVTKLIDNGYYPGRPYIGIQFYETSVGIEVASYAFGNELLNGDLIYKINGTEVKSANSVYEILGSKNVGDKLRLSIARKSDNPQSGPFGDQAYEYITVEITVHSIDDYYALEK